MSLKNYIKNDLEIRLRSGQDLPAQLTLESLAEHYQVSFSPVRIALAELVEEGLLQKGANRRLVRNAEQIKPLKRGQTSKLPEPPADMFEVITNDFVKLSLKGEPIDIREEVTARKYKISRSSLRIILNRLAGTGILDHIPRRGWRLRPFRQEDMQAFLEVRELLELKALELAKPHLKEADLQKILDGNVIPQSAREGVQIDNSLHEYLIEKAGNYYIKDFFQRQGRYYDILFDWEDQDRETAIETVRQHQAILTALMKKDWRAARKALSYHIRDNHPILSKIIKNK
ncbi:GntR family transcriptional regulator [Gimesia sp.]|uniref:GntR family transcriptional regulator n=1 Tax=Gimesia sp. TaxID=2024833 RepID=UPI000C47407F|nr:GntR family transcriptional regulator [Gimesia sp.]MAX41020.1 transcriptional regulator [Gimesia sp.]HAH45001.1 transcriptional regulator [Planctomycetaceae bacterium]HBL44026.1 transcriptional regulator [Planctomycetaceae bacterium]|tara:strand:- start:1414 stop:2274 length:861 start_codon:yes stop_codon:yes gene_type:complete